MILAGYKTVKEALVTYADEFGDREISPIFHDITQGHGMTLVCYNKNCAMALESILTLSLYIQ